MSTCRLATVLLLAWATAGCETGDKPDGGPGANGGAVSEQEQNEDTTFTVSLAEEKVQIPAGSQQELVISIDRGEKFEQTVTAEIQAPQGVSVEPKTVEFQAGQEEGKVLVQVLPEAPVGRELAVKIDFRPQSGRPLSKQLLVMVTDADGEDGAPQANGETETDGAPLEP